jgi:transcriptional regulator with XRE-family HTH domain
VTTAAGRRTTPLSNSGASRRNTVPAELAELLAASRRARKLSLTQLAKKAGASTSHLSRIERGERDSLSRELLGRLATALDLDPERLFAAARLLPPDVERELANPAFAGALFAGYEVPAPTRALLRRVHIARAVEREFPQLARELVNPKALLEERSFAVEISEGAEAVAIDGMTVRCSATMPATARFLLAHALGHAVLEPDPLCSFNTFSPEEQDATAFAAFVLAPPGPLRRTVFALAGSYDVWRGASGALIEAAAVRVAAPAWLVARRITEDGLLAELAKVADL